MSKRVRFNENLNCIHYIYGGDECRNGSVWVMCAVDAMRFKRRIDIVGEVINLVLVNEHRCKVYKERFADIFLPPAED